MMAKGNIVDSFQFGDLLDDVETLLQRVFSGDPILPTMLAGLAEARLITVPSEEIVLHWQQMLITLQNYFDIDAGVATLIEVLDSRSASALVES